MPPVSNEFDVACRAAQAASVVLKKYFHDGVAIRQKQSDASYNLVSDADVESEQAIARVIRETFPQHALLGEEGLEGDVQAEHLWIIDPLDGTTNFVHHLPHFAISIAYYQNCEAHTGVVVNPIRDDWFVSVRGEGAWHNDRRVHVSRHDTLNQVLVGTGFYYDRGAMMEGTLNALRDLFHRDIHGVRRFGTASLDLSMVGVGGFGAFFEYELSPWDFAAGRLFVEEAGGQVTTCDGRALPLAKTSVLASNGHLHDTVLEIVARHRIV